MATFDVTVNFGWELPQKDRNPYIEDVDRLRRTLIAIDAAFASVPAEAQAAIAAILGQAPETLNALDEIAAALGNDPNFATTILADLATRATKAELDAAIEDVQTSQVYFEPKNFTATDGQTIFSAAGWSYTSPFCIVYLNGVKMRTGVDVEVASGTSIVFAEPTVAGDLVDAIAFNPFNVMDAAPQARVAAIESRVLVLETAPKITIASLLIGSA